MTQKGNIIYAVLIASTLIFSGCSLSQMVKMSQEQELTVAPSPLELHGNTVDFDMSAKIPVKMLKKGKVYTVKTFYEYGDKEHGFDGVDFSREQFPNYDTEQPSKSASFSMPYEEAMKSGRLTVQGVASDPKSGKEKASERLEVARGVITTSQLYKPVAYAAYAPHGYNNQEELIPTNTDFYFLQGSSVLRSSERRSDRGKNFDAFIAEKNVTRTVTITGTHSPEGAERVNSRLSQDRAEAIQAFYDRQMRRYDYEGMADSINFILKPVVEDWQEFKEMLADYDGINDEDKTEIRNIVDGSGSFEEKEDALHKLSAYRKVFRDVYPQLRTAKTEVLTVKEKKSDSEIAVLAKQIAGGTVSSDTLNDQELGYAATLTPSLDEKESIYMAATKKNDSWASHNNLGAVYLEKAMKTNNTELLEKALTQFELANRKQENAEAHNNLASIYLVQGNVDAAAEAVSKALGMNPSNELTAEINGVKGLVELRQGNYDAAIRSLSSSKESSENLYNKGLAQLLNKDYQNALTSFNEVTKGNNNDAMAHYAAAITSARLGNADDAVQHLSAAANADASIKEMAAGDLEFLSVKSNPGFIDALK